MPDFKLTDNTATHFLILVAADLQWMIMKKQILRIRFSPVKSMIDDSLNSLQSDYLQFVGEKLNSIGITPNEVFDVLKTLHIGNASDPDGIDNKILWESALQISTPLCRLFNLCLDKCVLPTAWKTSLVCPILKERLSFYCI